MIKAVGFDLGDTLVQYKDVPLSWDALYENALRGVLLACKGDVTNDDLTVGMETLSSFNTRLFSRVEEVSADHLFSQMLSLWQVDVAANIDLAVNTFFDYFQSKVAVYNDTIAILRFLKDREIKVGILTDVPYGMPKDLVLKDVAPFRGMIDCILTSVDVGVRKPHSKGYLLLASELGVEPSEMLYVGNEEKDMRGANDSNYISVLINRKQVHLDYSQKKTIANLKEIELLINL